MSYGFFTKSGSADNCRIVTGYSVIPVIRTVSFWAKWDGSTTTPNDYDDMAILSHLLSQGDDACLMGWDGGFINWVKCANQEPNPVIANRNSGWQNADWTPGDALNVVIRINETDSFDSRKNNPLPDLFINGVKRNFNYWLNTPAATALPLGGGSNKWQIGRGRNRYGGSNQFKGEIAEVAMYDGWRSDDECIAISAGRSVLNYDVSKLKFYYPLKDDAIDWVSKVAGEVTGAKKLATHPTIIQPAVAPTPPPAPPPPDPAKTRSIYFLGNSLSDTVGGLPFVADSAGYATNYGRHMIPGTPLFGIRVNSTQGFTEEPMGYFLNALANYTLDCLSLQPFTRDITGDNNEGDLYNCKYFIDLALPKSPDLKAYVYEQWCTREGVSTFTSATWEATWMLPYTAGSFNYDMQPYYTALINELRKPGVVALKTPCLMVPVGTAMREFNKQAGAGQISGYSSAWDLYQPVPDMLHLNNIGGYLACCVFFACFWGVDPHLTQPTSKYDPIPTALKTKLQDIAWDVVTGHPFSGVTKPVPVVPKTPPTAEINGTIAPIVAAGTDPKTILVRYKATRSGEKIDASSIGSDDLIVTKGS